MALSLKFLFLLPTLLLFCDVLAEEQLDQQLEPFRPLLGKTWEGKFLNTKPENTIVDVSRWERALNGKAVRILHSINNGIYGGETIIFWDKEKARLSFYYFTTEGSYDDGTITPEGNGFVTNENVHGDPDGTTEVKATSEFLPDGTFHVKAEYLTGGKWAPGHEVNYRQVTDKEPVFK